MRIAVLSGTGFVGRAIVGELARAGHKMLLVHRGMTEPPELPQASHVHVPREQLVTSRDRIRAFEPDAVVDVSAMNGEGAAAALAALPDSTRLLVLSSCDVYRAYQSLLAGQHSDPVPLTESSPLRFARHIEGGQWENLEIEERYGSRGATIFRLGAVYGEHDHQRRLDFVLRRVRAGRRRIPIGGGTWLFSRVYVGDVATAVERALSHNEVEGEVFNICERATSPYRLFVEQILAAAEFEAELVRVPDAVLPPDLHQTGDFAQHLLVSAEKARHMLDWSDRDPDLALSTAVRWHLENPPADERSNFADDDLALASAKK